MNPKIKSLHFYPLKSAQGLSVSEMEITETGPKHDREWMLINQNGSFVTQRTHPQMSQIQTQLKGQQLIFKAQGMSELSVSLNDYGEESLPVSVFSKEASARKLKNEFSEWFSDFLKTKIQIVRSDPDNRRHTSGNHGPVTPIQFADGYPLLLTNESTLQVLSDRVGSEVPMLRFRPNVVIENCPADAEDTWESFKSNDIDFLCAKACTRCTVIDVDPSTAKKDKVVSHELKKYRAPNNNILFGINLIQSKNGTLRVGDSLTDIKEK